VGIPPTVEVTLSLKAAAEGRDEALEKALALLE
jgi:hypothetical protein